MSTRFHLTGRRSAMFYCAAHRCDLRRTVPAFVTLCALYFCFSSATGTVPSSSLPASHSAFTQSVNRTDELKSSASASDDIRSTAHPTDEIPKNAGVSARPLSGDNSDGTENEFDLLVIGGGSAGISCARRAAKYSTSSRPLRIGIVEMNRVGGTCVNFGCIPKKMLWFAAEIRAQSCASPHFGFLAQKGTSYAATTISPTCSKFSWQAHRHASLAYISKLQHDYSKNLENEGIILIKGRAEFDAQQPSPSSTEDAHHSIGIEIQTLEGATIRIGAKKVVIATGSTPRKLHFEGSEYLVDNEQFFDMPNLPMRAAVYGGGYISVEFAQILAMLGTEVHIFHRDKNLLRRFDRDIVALLSEAMLQQHIKLNNESTVRRIVASKVHLHPQETVPDNFDGEHRKYTVHLDGGQIEDGFDVVVHAIGRVPRIQGLGLNRVGVKVVGSRIVSKNMETSHPHICIAGDVTGELMLASAAVAAGRTLAERLFGGSPTAYMDLRIYPTVVFSHPPIGSVGMTQEEAVAKFGEENIRTISSSYVNNFYGLWDGPTNSKPRSLVKLICLKTDDDRVLGLHVIGLGADEMLQGYAVAIRMGARKKDLDATLAIHPTAAEEVVTLAPWKPLT